MTTDIPITAVQAREWIEDARYLAYPDRIPSDDQGIAAAVTLLEHLARYLQHSVRWAEDVALPRADSDSVGALTARMWQVTDDLSTVFGQLSVRFEEFAADPDLRHVLGLRDHPEVSHAEAAGIAHDIATAFAAAADHAQAAATELTRVPRQHARIYYTAADAAQPVDGGRR